MERPFKDYKDASREVPEWLQGRGSRSARRPHHRRFVTDLFYWTNVNGKDALNELHNHAHAGDLVLFPSYLKHEVCPNPSERERINLAFNVTVIRKGSGPAGLSRVQREDFA